MELSSPKKINTLNKTPLGETGCSSNLYYLLTAQSSSLLFTTFSQTQSVGSLHLTVQPMCDLRDVVPRHWSPSASHPTLAQGSRAFP